MNSPMTGWRTIVADTDFDRIKKKVRQFVVERDWDQFHSPKNLSMALIVEAAEMVEHFQWLTEEQSSNLSPKKLAEVEQELADIQVYLINLAEKLKLDLIAAVEKKLVLNAQKYPADQVRGSSKKYTEYKSGSRGED
jgi:NTP pyrophosphatase (non-canonical NTP hydrolase)